MTWRRRRAAEWAAWTRTLPWRVAITFGVGAAGGVLGSLLAPRLSVVLGALAAVAAGWGFGSGPVPTLSPGDGERRASDAPPDYSANWRGRGGQSCTTWPSRTAGPTSTTW